MKQEVQPLQQTLREKNQQHQQLSHDATKTTEELKRPNGFHQQTLFTPQLFKCFNHKISKNQTKQCGYVKIKFE